jgi:hypothetical protein
VGELRYSFSRDPSDTIAQMLCESDGMFCFLNVLNP